MKIYGNAVGGSGLERTYILVDDTGAEALAVMNDNEVTLDATANDIRIGKVAATSNGVIVGEKIIPSYNTTEGGTIIPAGETMVIKLPRNYEFTKLQALICRFNTSITDSVFTDKVSIEGKVYPVNSTEQIATVIVDTSNKLINLGIKNESDTFIVIRYFTYKEIY